MPRRYQKRRRAEQQEATRHKIVEAAVALHQTKGIAGTGITDIAERAGVGRLTVYRHFPDELALLQACSGLYWQRHPLPDSEPWRAVGDPVERTTLALGQAYAYHRQTEKMMVHAFAEAADSPIMAPYHEHWRRAADLATAAWRRRGRQRKLLRAAVGHAIVFPTWRSLTREQGLTDAQAVDLMVRLTCECDGD